MSSATTFPIELKGTNLEFGNANIPLAKARSFWVYTQQPPQINVYCHKDNYQTTFRLFTENAQNMNECVSQFMKNTEMRADLFSVWSVTPFIGAPVDEKGNTSEKSDASIEITFVQEADRDYFEKYASPLFPDFTLTKGVKQDKIYFAKLQSNEKDSEKNQVEKINNVFKRITESRFGSSRINHLLASLKDSRFPGKEYGHPSCIGKEWSQDHMRDYDVTREGITEKIHLISDIYASKATTPQEIESWLENPESYDGQGKQKYQHHMKDYILNKALKEDTKDLQTIVSCASLIPDFEEILKDAFSQVLKESPIDHKKLKPLLTAAGKVPNFDLGSLLEQIMKEANQS